MASNGTLDSHFSKFFLMFDDESVLLSSLAATVAGSECRMASYRRYVHAEPFFRWHPYTAPVIGAPERSTPNLITRSTCSENDKISYTGHQNCSNIVVYSIV